MGSIEFSARAASRGITRAALNREIETCMAGLMENIADLDDLVLQFTGTETGAHFQTAWKQARITLDAGHGPGEDEPIPSRKAAGLAPQEAGPPLLPSCPNAAL